MYNYNHLYYFYVTVKSGGFTSAAKHLRISQPSLSSQIKVLEEALDIKLFNKVGRNNKLTPEGSVVYGFCRQMFELAEEMKELISKDIPHASRRIYIGVSYEVANSFVVEVVSLFLKKFGDRLRPKVMMVSGDHDQLVEQLRFREIDAIVSNFPMTSLDLKNLEKRSIPVDLIYAAPKKLPRSIKQTNLASAIKALSKDGVAQWVMPPPRFKLRSETDQFFEKNLMKGRLVFESDTVESLIRSIVDNFGIGFLLSIYVPNEIADKSLNRFGPKKGFWQHQLYLACHSQNRNDHLINTLTLSFKEVNPT